MDQQNTIFDGEALLFRLHEGLTGSDKNVVFVVGAPLTAPYGDARGVADVAAVVELIRKEFENKRGQLEKLDAALANSTNPYQTAFTFLSGRAGQDAANRIIRRAVSRALVPNGVSEWEEAIDKVSVEQLGAMDRDPRVWCLPAGVSALGTLIANFPDRFGQIVITSNFDPLTEIAIAKSGGEAWRTSLSGDGSIFQSSAKGCQVLHIHGYWHGTDTLHTSSQLIINRPNLKNDLLTLIKDKIVVVMAYGGWSDIFTSALAGVVSNDNLFPEILWTFYDENPIINDHIRSILGPGIDRNRVTFYKGIDCHRFLPELLELWREDKPEKMLVGQNVEGVEAASVSRLDRARLFRLAPLECDRPPTVGAWVGRESELRSLETSKANVVVISGMGGEGKSALASHYINTLDDREGGFQFWDWRDCKEQGDRIRTQIIEIIVRFSENRISSEDLKCADDNELIEVMIDQTRNSMAIIVFDNVDSYVDLENKTFTGLLEVLIQKISVANTKSRVLITCRPDIQYKSSSVLTFTISGISENDAIELFEIRAQGCSIPHDDIRAAHALTKGHAFWLDLLALQITKVPGVTLRGQLNDLRRGRDDAPDVLSTIWDKLALREKTLLRFMAEAVRPETEKTIQQFSSAQLNFKNFDRALKSLIALNLIVVKPESDAPDLYDLHPLVRRFVRSNFVLSERKDYIRVVLHQYDVIIGAIESFLGVNLPFPMLERWSQKVELLVSLGLFDQAFETLTKIESACIGGGHVQEYVRVARLLFESIDWETAALEYKSFDRVVGIYITALDSLGEYDSADRLLARYEITIPQKTARYIHFCDIKCYSLWGRGQFETAVEWGARGVNLKKETNVDTDFDAAHNLALAQRDAGQLDDALKHFLGDSELDAFIQGRVDETANGAKHGNVGRCLQLLGREQDALYCYKRSMKSLENDSTLYGSSNRAYARQWIGEIFSNLGYADKAEAFLIDAIRMLGSSAPVRVRKLYSDIEGFRHNKSQFMNEVRASKIVNQWLKAVDIF